MKAIYVSLGLILISSSAQAIERYTSTSMTCARVKAAINADGAAIMRYTSTRVAGLPLYGKYVRNGNFCDRGEATERAYIPASDTRSCPVWECKRIENIPKDR
ncbi:hypothetical protein [Arvimicrobium flavum]|uniref:hypothetical protein n=1 Tax=Arvimicrobium flavum TaxID=3393320 RepID=UPI00237BBAAC|nr:hypothetical protein [Mesorhizobium shangrilense]